MAGLARRLADSVPTSALHLYTHATMPSRELFSENLDEEDELTDEDGDDHDTR